MAKSAGSPYLTIWTEPRKTIRNIVDSDPRHQVLFLVIVGAEMAALSAFAAKPAATLNMPGADAATVQQVMLIAGLAALVVAPLMAIVSLYVGGAMLRWAGGLIGGVATSAEVRAAIAWSTIPSIAAAAINLVALTTGLIRVPPAPRKFEGLTTVFQQLNAAEVVALVIGIWGAVIWFNCLGEVHRFSAWRALAASIIAGVVAAGAMLAAGIILMMVVLVFTHHI